MSQYARGASFERQVKADLEQQEWVVVRAAGSKGPADLVAMRSGRVSYMVACRVKRQWSGGELDRLYDYAMAAGAEPILAYRVKETPRKVEIAYESARFAKFRHRPHPRKIL